MKPLQFLSLLDLKARMSLKSEASKLYLSYLWWVLEPILWVLVFYFVFETLLGTGRGNFLFFLMCGKIPFLWFSKSVTGGASSIVLNKGLINQTNVPKYFFPYLALQEVLYKQWLVFLVLFGLAALYGYMPSLHWLWLIPLLIVQYLLIILCTLLAALVVSYVGDMRILINMAMMFLMFSSGIFWEITRIADPVKQELVLTWNPLAFLIDAYRKVIMHGAVYDLGHLINLGGIFLIALVLIHWIYRVKSQDIAARVINA
jgi:lipopolysaccharide transport system permease protein